MGKEAIKTLLDKEIPKYRNNLGLLQIATIKPIFTPLYFVVEK